MTALRRRRLETCVVFGLMLLSAACEPERRVPYIPPKLENWPQPYKGTSGLKLHAFTTGYLTTPEAMLLRGGALTRTRELPVPAFVIEHPKQGLVLVGTGLGPTATTTPSAGDRLIALGTQLHTAPGSDLKTQMQRAGLKPERVRWIVLPSVRAHQIGEVETFPRARVVVAQAEQKPEPNTLHSATSPVKEVQNWEYVDFDSVPPFATFTAARDLFGDGSVMLIDARGATPGTMAVLLRLPHQPLLLAGDAIAVGEQLRRVIQPASAFDGDAWWDRTWRLKRFQDLVPQLIVVPGHDLTPLDRDAVHDVVVHASPAAAPVQRPVATPGMLDRLLRRRFDS